ncbi:MAG: hypothetical protein HQ567_04860 [Candidatus Nealsonbacteria bacterium]|nr:hypothetical protein [Candidatus Nealsonbacteria bacterium]
MTTQRNGSVSAMETRPRIRKIGTGCFFLALLTVGYLAFLRYGYDPPKDNNGDLPDDAVRNFIELVKADDYEAAKELWFGQSKRVSGGPIEFPIEFEEFCARFKHIDLNNCVISKAHRGKSGFSMVYIDWEESGEKKHYSFGLKIFGGDWRMERGYDW